MDTPKIYILTLSKHYGVQKTAFRTFEQAWDFAAKAIRESGGELSADNADDCRKQNSPIQPSFTSNWIVGKIGHAGLPGSDIGPTVIYELEL